MTATTKPADGSTDGLATAIADLAEVAGRLVAQVYAEHEIDVRTKDDASPVTEADERAEEAILAGLAELTPEVPVVAEERVSAGEVPTNLGQRFWLVDPLDGTKEFLSRNGEFTVNIALVESGVPVLGVVHAPALAQTYVGDARGGDQAAGASTGAASTGGARLRAGGRDVPLTVRAVDPAGFAVLVSRSHLDEKTEAWLTGVSVAERVSAGSSLKFCRIAEGRADLYPRFGRTMEWDTAAGDAVLRAAGGSVVDEGGAELRYGKPDFANPPFIAYGQQLPRR